MSAKANTPQRTRSARRRLHRTHVGPSMYQLTLLMDALASTEPEQIDILRTVTKRLADDSELWAMVKSIQQHEINRKKDVEKLREYFRRIEKAAKKSPRVSGFHRVDAEFLTREVK